MLTEPEIPLAIWQHLLAPNFAKPVERILTGLSNSPVFRCELSTESGKTGQACLKATDASDFNFRRLLLAHQAIQIAMANGTNVLPEFIPAGKTPSKIVESNRLWQLAQWMPGIADYDSSPSRARLCNAMQVLAKLHSSWQSISLDFEGTQAVESPGSPALRDRIRLLQDLRRTSELERWKGIPRNPTEQSLVHRTANLVSRFGKRWLAELEFAANSPVKLHIVLRDIWSDHVLFTGDQVSGIIDLGAMRIDEAAIDVARLIGSLEPKSPENWLAGVKAYQEFNPTSELNRVILLDKVSCLLSAVQWLRWLIVERRQFNTPTKDLMSRWSGFLQRLENEFWQGIEA